MNILELSLKQSLTWLFVFRLHEVSGLQYIILSGSWWNIIQQPLHSLGRCKAYDLNQRWYILSFGPLQTNKQKNFSENLIELHIFAFKKMHLKMLSGKMTSILSGPQWVNMNQVFILVYSRSVTMPGLGQNWSLLPTSGRFRRKVVLANYGVKKKLQGNMCWADVGSISAVRCRANVASTLDWCRPPTSAQHRIDVSDNTWIL